MYFDSQKIKAIIPYIGPMLLLFGYLRLDLYYSQFSISIYRFLDLQEILTTFLDDLILLLLIIIAGFIFDVFTTTKDEIITRSIVDSKSLEEKSVFRRFGDWIKFYLPWLIPCNFFFLLYLIVTYIVLRRVSQSLIIAFLLSNSIILFGFITMEIRRVYFLVNNKVMSSTAFNTIFGIMMVTVLLVIHVNYQVESVKNFKSTCGVTIVADSFSMASDSLHYYIGQTKNYLFIHYQDSSKTIVFPMNRIKSITFK